ncbi:aldo/keto reductase [Prauserella marina]|uniref:D-threo-aldose 1-dehydrogenase n=1 Tax=Prauserella marina TaxID=530584 RepID=A0A222VMP4_9PSEU|nr:aldo/keto reductase [Prauserella marina]ASR34991.1 aldo/keto reductase [Prauserella marina]PWV85281.1 D-threo-aldose 1-dehydrogenase [Prauserella marina]SDC00659.1 D-threo-aldose 1-dehydrogenase [Prauserella marina]
MVSRGLGVLGYGTAALGNLYEPVTDEQAALVLEAAWDCGIRYFDTAPHYGLGLAERRLGAFLATKPRDEYVVSTKVGRRLVPDPGGARTLDTANHYVVPADRKRVWDFSADGIRRSLDASLSRMGIADVDIVYLHDPDEYELDLALATGLDAVAALREQGVIGAAGIGSKSTKALLAGARSGILDLLMVAGRFTLAEQPAAEELLPYCREHGVGVACAGVFNSGLLATPFPAEDGKYEYATVPAGVLTKVRAIAAVCAEFGVDLPTAALRFAAREPSVRTVVTGAASAAQLRQNVRRMAEPVPEELWKALRDKGLTSC